MCSDSNKSSSSEIQCAFHNGSSLGFFYSNKFFNGSYINRTCLSNNLSFVGSNYCTKSILGSTLYLSTNKSEFYKLYLVSKFLPNRQLAGATLLSCNILLSLAVCWNDNLCPTNTVPVCLSALLISLQLELDPSCLSA
ncbi:hypothetical protein I3842_03G085500 [Carya illinoinensis]|uniref:Uncharacterized protein n=1 Tax=Carya illinoinensis TaxID=32201 RepID=A0A922FHW8_CARIL|nr:hypothetical protein I3842_03G085500 [Carya illinoinensis]